MKTTVLLLTLIVAPFALSGCSKSCEDVTQEYRKALEARDLDAAEDLAYEMQQACS